MSGDRLARLETFWKSEAVLEQAPSLVGDVVALVEIAKAARVAMASVDDTDFEDAVIALRLALARLDSGATKGDA